MENKGTQKVEFAQKIHSTVILRVPARKILNLRKENPSNIEIETAFQVRMGRLSRKLAENASRTQLVKNILEEMRAVMEAAKLMGFIDLSELYAAASQPPPPRGSLNRGRLAQRK